MPRPVERVYLGVIAAGIALALLMGAIGLWVGLWLSSQRPTRIASRPPAATTTFPESAGQGPPGAGAPASPGKPGRSAAAARAPAVSAGRAAVDGHRRESPGGTSATSAKPVVTAPPRRVVGARGVSFREARAVPLATATAGARRARTPGVSIAVKPSREELGRLTTRACPPAPRQPHRRRVQQPGTRRPPPARDPQMLSGDGAGMGPAALTIPLEAEPLMIRALSAYHVTDDAPFRELRRQGWSFADMATAGNLAARSRRPLYQITRAYQARRDWAAVARETNVPPDAIYLALNAPRAVLLTDADAERRLAPADRLGSRSGPAAGRAPGGHPTSAAPWTGTPAERVAGARLELTPRTPAALLHRAVAIYYALPAGTVRELAARGWTMGDLLVAGNLAYRSEASFEEIIALRDAGQEWETIARQVGAAPEELYEPAAPRRVITVP